MQTLELIRAGAGSGKTTNLCDTVAAAVREGMDPARILATTFTNKAAAELKSRIQAELISNAADSTEAHKAADRLELAAIGTVHSVAHRMLSRYAIELGLSPRLEVMDETAVDRALNDLLTRIPLDVRDAFGKVAGRLGIKDINVRLLSLLAAIRGNLISETDFSAQMQAGADRVCELLAPSGPAKHPQSAADLQQLIEQAEHALTALTNDTTKKTRDAIQKLRELKAGRHPLWARFVEAGRITAAKGSGADDLLDPLRLCSSRVKSDPALHADVRQFAHLLAEETVRLSQHYKDYKAQRGLVDFTDLETYFLELLRDPAHLSQLKADFDLILVDEFQDTNPLQLAIFQQLRSLAPRSRWVGDPKQAIYGFRDADAQLVQDVWDAETSARSIRLPDNHRSQRGLVQLTGALFAPVLGDDARQNPARAEMPRGVERWILDSKNKGNDVRALACGIAKLNDEGTALKDIAVLVHARRSRDEIAGALNELGIPCLFESPGLLSTREGAMLLAGLRLVVDRRDSLAAATILHILSDPEVETPDWIAERLVTRQQQSSAAAQEDGPVEFTYPWQDDPRLAAVETVDRTLCSPTEVVDQLIEALKLPERIQAWGDTGRRSSHLDSVLRHMADYEDMCLNNGQAATVRGLILQLEQLAGQQLDVRYPPQGHEAVTLSTYHSAKGLEWPVVILTELDSDSRVNMWSPAVTGGGPTQSFPLDNRQLRYWIWPFGRTGFQLAALRRGSGLNDAAVASAEGQQTLLQDEAELLRLLYVGFTRARDKVVLVHRPGKYTWLQKLPEVDDLLCCDSGDGEYDIDGVDTTLVVRTLNADMVNSHRRPSPETERWIQAPSTGTQAQTCARFHSPSAVQSETSGEQFSIEPLQGRPHFPSGVGPDRYAALGNAVHSYLAALPSLVAASDAIREKVAERCLTAHDAAGTLSPADLVETGVTFCAWVESKWPGAQWHVEVPASAARGAGGAWRGTIDLLLRLPNGHLVVIDHKSAPLQRKQCADKAAEYAGQLNTYTEMLEALSEVVDSAWIHFPLAAVVAQMTNGK